MAGVTGVSLAATVRAVFSEPMNAATFTTSTMVLRNAANVVIPATVTYEATFRTGVLTPSSPLAGGTRYTATITGGSAGVKDVAGNALASHYVSSFTTTGTPPALPTVTMSASPASITSGAASTLTWSSTNATTRLNQPGHRDGRRIRHEVGEPDLHNRLHADSHQRGVNLDLVEHERDDRLHQPRHRDGHRIRHEVGEPALHDHLHRDSDQRVRFGRRQRRRDGHHLDGAAQPLQRVIGAVELCHG